jgi:hypothetical protein
MESRSCRLMEKGAREPEGREEGKRGSGKIAHVVTLPGVNVKALEEDISVPYIVAAICYFYILVPVPGIRSTINESGPGHASDSSPRHSLEPCLSG